MSVAGLGPGKGSRVCESVCLYLCGRPHDDALVIHSRKTLTAETGAIRGCTLEETDGWCADPQKVFPFAHVTYSAPFNAQRLSQLQKFVRRDESVRVRRTLRLPSRHRCALSRQWLQCQRAAVERLRVAESE